MEFLFGVRLTLWVFSINCADFIIHDSVTFSTGWSAEAVLTKQKLFMDQDLGIINPAIYWQQSKIARNKTEISWCLDTCTI